MAPKKRAGSKHVVVVSKTRHRRKRVSGTAAVGRVHHKRRRKAAVGKKTRRRRRSVGATLNRSSLMEILKMAVGATAGVAANNLILYPAEKMLTDKLPMAGKAMGFAQAVLGGMITLKAKGNLGKAFGLTILAGGAQTIVRQFNLGAHIPGISGPNDEFTSLKIPISGNSELRSLVAGILENNETPNLPMVASHHGRHRPQYHHGMYSGESGGGRSHQDARMRSYVAGDEMDILPGKY